MTSAPQMGNLSHLFKSQASSYAQFRPTYPPQLYQALFHFAQLPSADLCLDVATGQGQAAVTLSETFQQVIAVDANEEQIKFAVQRPNIKYMVSDAHATGLPDSSVDLVTVAQALHWFDLDKFYSEAARILKPTGCLAAWTYSLHTFPDFPEATKLLDDLCYIKLGPYWSERRKLVDAQYQGYEPSGSIFQEVQHMPRLAVKRQTSISQVVGYVNSWSAYVTYCKQHGQQAGGAVIAAFTADLHRSLGVEDEQTPVEMELPFFMMMARLPVKQ